MLKELLAHRRHDWRCPIKQSAEYALTDLCRHLIAEHSIGNGEMYVHVPYGTLSRRPIISPGSDRKAHIFVEMHLCGCRKKIILDVTLAEVTDFTNNLVTTLKSARGLSIMHVHNISLAGSQSAKAICRLLRSTRLEPHIIHMADYEIGTLCINDFARPPRRGEVLRYLEKNLGSGF